MKYATIISRYSLEKGEIGKPIGQASVVEYSTGKKALLALHSAIRSNSRNNRFLIGLPDGQQVPLDTAYTEIFGVAPIRRDGRENSYPKLK